MADFEHADTVFERDMSVPGYDEDILPFRVSFPSGSTTLYLPTDAIAIIALGPRHLSVCVSGGRHAELLCGL